MRENPGGASGRSRYIQGVGEAIRATTRGATAAEIGGKGINVGAEDGTGECAGSRGATQAADAASGFLRALPVDEVYAELRSYAQKLLNKERVDHTLQATALVHEAWSRLAHDGSGRWRAPGEFFAIATRVMEQVLVDHARKHQSVKRGSGRKRQGVDLGNHAAAAGTGEGGVDCVAMHAALVELEKADARAAELVRLRFFAGLTSKQAADVLGISLPAAEGEWRATRAWLSARLRRPAAARTS